MTHPSRITIPEYESPKGQSPASMRFLMRMGYDNECFAAAVLSLAVKGHLRIQQDAGILGLGKTFTLVKQSSPDAKPLSADEEQLLINLFSEGSTLKLEQENHERVSEARTNHRLSLKDRYTSGFFNINGGWHFLGIVLSILLALPALFLPGKTTSVAGMAFHHARGAGSRCSRCCSCSWPTASSANCFGRRRWRVRRPWITSADSRCTWKWPKVRSSNE